MNIKTVHTVYFSPTNTTKKIADAIANATGASDVAHDLTHVKTAKAPAPFAADELVVIALPVYAGRIPAPMLPFINALKGSGTPAVLVGVYGNRHFDDFLVELEDIVKPNGFVPVAAGAFIGEHSFSDKLGGGRPNADDLAQAAQFGKQIADKLAKAEGPALAATIPGQRPYRVFATSPKFGPTVSDACVDCGSCAAACPMGIINPQNAREIDGSQCIKCRACAHVCPQKAIDFAPGPFWEHTRMLEAKFSAPRTNLTVI